MTKYEHLMYASPSRIQQIYAERYGDVSQVQRETSKGQTSTVGGRLGALIGSLRGETSETTTKRQIKQINFDDEHLQTKRVVNNLVSDADIPSVTELYDTKGNPAELYRFSSEVTLTPAEGEFEDRNYLEVAGYEGRVKFRGMTSMENWGSRSNILTAMQANDTYPFQGVLSPVSLDYTDPTMEEYAVHFLFICAPDSDELQAWRNRKSLCRDQDMA